MNWQDESHPFEENSFLDELTEYMQSPQGQLEDAVRDSIADELEDAGIDIEKRLILWKDGTALTVGDSARRVHAGNAKLPLHEIEAAILSWLEYCEPVNYENASPEKLDGLETHIAEWIKTYKLQFPKKRS